jgi:hypothetical protein
MGDYFVTGSDFFRLMEALTGQPFDKDRRSRVRRLLEPYVAMCRRIPPHLGRA